MILNLWYLRLPLLSSNIRVIEIGVARCGKLKADQIGVRRALPTLKRRLIRIKLSFAFDSATHHLLLPLVLQICDTG